MIHPYLTTGLGWRRHCRRLPDEIQGGDPIGGIEGAIGAIAGLVPFALTYGVVVPVAEALGGTLVDLAGLFDLES
ncbi:MAG: hypothetical protein ABI253_02370 [Mycobacterium sp.]